jgi:hypothetical protein
LSPKPIRLLIWRMFLHELKQRRSISLRSASFFFKRLAELASKRTEVGIKTVEESEKSHQFVWFVNHRRARAPRPSSSACLSRPLTRLLTRVLYPRGLKFNTSRLEVVVALLLASLLWPAVSSAHPRGTWWTPSRGKTQIIDKGLPLVVGNPNGPVENVSFIEGDEIKYVECRGSGKARVLKRVRSYRHLRCRITVLGGPDAFFPGQPRVYVATLHALTGFPSFRFQLTNASLVG